MRRTLLGCIFVAGLAIVACSPRVDAGAILKIDGLINSTKTLYVYGYYGNGDIEIEDFYRSDLLIGSADLKPDEEVGSDFTPVSLEFDLTEYTRHAPEGTEWIGFNFRESESSGSMLITEILVLGNFLIGSEIHAVVAVRASINAELEALTGSIRLGPPPYSLRNAPGPGETRGMVEFGIAAVPEPSTAILLASAVACSGIASLRRRGPSPG